MPCHSYVIVLGRRNCIGTSMFLSMYPVYRNFEPSVGHSKSSRPTPCPHPTHILHIDILDSQTPKQITCNNNRPNPQSMQRTDNNTTHTRKNSKQSNMVIAICA
ncbi:hypothetical protein K504DRAFT_153555 [Pleomassaria siparia CBS 279.74]|uniref:Uncharacterized protein n=1 Tax=Pleomassaria siparia CBS 279.74 TaxID=1314801 RepID=A0A6G1KN22_9PLEO|nr:hypothetical protein K504DRAFT_153555 [Pleomassaria siparia CBS 279.74]